MHRATFTCCALPVRSHQSTPSRSSRRAGRSRRSVLGWLAGVAVALVGFAAPAVGQAEDAGIKGTWMAQRDGTKVTLRFSQDHTFNTSFGIAPDDLTSTDEGLLLKRDAGTFVLSGTYDGQLGGGTFEFKPSERYRAELIKRKLGPVTGRRQLTLAAIDLRIAFIDELRSLGYDESLKRYTQMRIHRATPDFIRDLAAVGYKDLSARRLVEMRIHNVSVSFIREMAKLGYSDVSPKRLVAMRIHDVTPDYVRELVAGGFDKPSAKRLIDMRIHNVSPKYAARARDIGLDPSLKQLVQMRIHNVDLEFVDGFRKRGQPLTVREAIDFSIHGVNASLVESLEKLGYEKVKPRRLVELRIHGATPSWIEDVVARRKTRPSVRRLIEMRIHGIN